MEYGGEGEVTTEWDPDELARHATRVTAIKEKLHEKAGTNITVAQKKDKEYYYDKKHCDSQVPSCITTFLLECDLIATPMQVYTKGMRVMMRNSARESKKGDKMKNHWERECIEYQTSLLGLS